LLLISGADDP
jgi:hypothetical protein